VVGCLAAGTVFEFVKGHKRMAASQWPDCWVALGAERSGIAKHTFENCASICGRFWRLGGLEMRTSGVDGGGRARKRAVEL